MTEDVRETPFVDVQPSDLGYRELRFAKARGIVEEAERFFPDQPLHRDDALLWLFRTRSVEPVDRVNTRVAFVMPDPDDIPALAARYDLGPVDASVLTEDALRELSSTLDRRLASEVREASLYSEKFHGKGTAFGETFDMHAFTAAHRSFPQHTLVRVRRVDDGRSVVVRINDRGPYVVGRDIDLSLAAFTSIADRAEGTIDVTLERLGDARVVSPCVAPDLRQRRVADGVVLSPGVPHVLHLGQSLRLQSNVSFVIRDVSYPDGAWQGMQTWVTPGESYELTPSIEGTYRFVMGTLSGRRREMTMRVVQCDGESVNVP